MREIDFLQEIGLEQKEALLYRHALEFTHFSVMQISQKTGLKRPTCYLILDSLIKKGLISILPQSRKALYKAESADILLQQIEKNMFLAKKFIPLLNAVQEKNEQNPIIKLYSGQKGIQNIYNDIFKTKVNSYKYIGSTEDVIYMAGEDFIKEHIVKRLKNKVKVFGIRMREKEIQESVYSEDKNYLREIRFAPQGFSIPGIVFLYDTKVAFISSAEGNFGFMIQGEDFYKTVSAFFDIVWNISEKK